MNKITTLAPRPSPTKGERGEESFAKAVSFGYAFVCENTLYLEVQTASCLSDHEISYFAYRLDITGGDVQRYKLAATLSSTPFPDDPRGSLCDWTVYGLKSVNRC